MTSRKRRSDFGTFQMTERDLYLLTWIGEMYAIRFDQLHTLVNRLKGRAVSVSNIKWLTNRWREAGLVEKRKMLAGEPQWVWLTKNGIEQAGIDVPYWTPKAARLRHIYVVNAVRLYQERDLKVAARWVSERYINPARKQASKKHLVDAELILQDTTIAIEVELIQKSQKRLSSILRELKREYHTVWYYVADECHTAVTSAIQSIPKHEEVFIIYPLSAML